MIWATFHDVSCGAPAYTQTTEYGDMGGPGGANLHGAKDCWNMLKPQCVTDMKLCSSKPQKGKIFQMNIYWFQSSMNTEIDDKPFRSRQTRSNPGSKHLLSHRYSEVCCFHLGQLKLGDWLFLLSYWVFCLLSDNLSWSHWCWWICA